MCPAPRSIDINSDVGESFGSYTVGADAGLFPLISSANVACGFHGGDPRVMERTVTTLAELGVAVGAHPGFPDLVGFGRRDMHLSPDELRTDVMYQIGALKAFCLAAGVSLHHVKPHGAMYNMAAKDAGIAAVIVRGIMAAAPETMLYAQDGSALARAADDAGLRVAYEVFADRAYLSDGRLAPRSCPDAMLHDPIEVAERVIRMTRGEAIPTVDGEPIVVKADTICIHSDTPAAVMMAKSLRAALEDAGVEVRATE